MWLVVLSVIVFLAAISYVTYETVTFEV